MIDKSSMHKRTAAITKHSKKLSAKLALLLAAGLLVFSALAALDPSLVGYNIVAGTGTTSASTSGSLLQPTPTPPPLSPGQVWVEKSIVYNQTGGAYDGTITVTLTAQAATYTDASGSVGTLPLVQMPSGDYVTVTDDLGMFGMLTSPLPAGVTLDTTGATPVVTWDITNQQALIAGPISVSYDITMATSANQPYVTNFWYETGIANVVFEPTVGNPYYYTLQETTYYQFEISMNWNNGTGLNSGAIMDNATGQTIVFPKNISPQNQPAYTSTGAMNTAGGWNWWPQNTATRSQAATVVTASGTQYYSWQLQWTQASGQKSYYFTVKDLGGPGVDVVYEVVLQGGGGSGSAPGGKTTVSTTYFERVYNSDQTDPFYWSGDLIEAPIDVMGEILLQDPTVTIPLAGTITVDKVFPAGSTNADWGIDDTYLFPMYVYDTTTGYYAIFQDDGGGQYSFQGFSIRPWPIYFSVDQPAVLTGLPSADGEGVAQTYNFEELTTWMAGFARPPAVTTTYDVSPDGTTAGSLPTSSTALLTPTEAIPASVTVNNNFTSQPLLTLRLMKLLDGFPADWGVSTATQFQVQVYDLNAGNTLLWVAPDAQASADGASGVWADYANWAHGTLYCVGNDGGNPTGPPNITDPYWAARIAAGTATASATINIYDLVVQGLSNIWPSDYEIIELDFNGVPLSASPMNAWWQDYINIYPLTRVEAPNSNIAPTGTLSPGNTYIATITNYFQHGEANLSLFKELQGYPQDWGVDNDTIFYVDIWDMTNNTTLLFDPTPDPSTGTLLQVGYIDASGNRVLEDLSWAGDLATAIDMLPISVNAPLVLTGIYTGADHHYMVREYDPDGHAVTFLSGPDRTEIPAGAANGIVVTPAENINIYIVNTYLSKDTGAVQFEKDLAGAWQSVVTTQTVFDLSLKSESTGRELVFDWLSTSTTATIYEFVGEVAPSGQLYLLEWDAATGEPLLVAQPGTVAGLGYTTTLPFSASLPVEVDGLIPGNYTVTEHYTTPAGYSVSYTVADPVFLPDYGTVLVKVTNTYTPHQTPPQPPGPPGGGGGNGGGGDNGGDGGSGGGGHGSGGNDGSGHFVNRPGQGPETGDSAQANFWLTLMIAAVLLIAGTVATLRKPHTPAPAPQNLP